MLMDKLHELQSCNSPYIQCNSLQLNCNLIATQLQLITTQLQPNQNNSFSTIMQLHYKCTHDIMLTSLIIIHLLKPDTWHYEGFFT
jgi:hypothetical protein